MELPKEESRNSGAEDDEEEHEDEIERRPRLSAASLITQKKGLMRSQGAAWATKKKNKQNE